MRKVTALLLGVLAGLVLVFVVSRFHLVRSSAGLHLIPKIENGWGHPYCDVRGYGVGEWTAHQSVVLAILKADRGDILEPAAYRSLRARIAGVSSVSRH